MSFGDWFKRIFAPGKKGTPIETPPDYMAGAPGITRLGDIETAKAVEDIETSTQAPEDPAP